MNCSLNFKSFTFVPTKCMVRKQGQQNQRKSVTVKSSADKPPDIYRDTPLRYMGYANEVGEAFAPYLPSWGVPASYAVATTYVLMDTIDKTKKTYEETESLKESAKEGIETLTWQMLASVFWPGSFVHLVVSLCPASRDVEGLPTLVGLLCIPLIVKPIDNTIDYVMENSVSKYLHDLDEMTAKEHTKAITLITLSLLLPPVLYRL